VFLYVENTEQGAQESDHFLRHAVRTTSSRDELTILKSPTNQYYFFLPLTFNHFNLIVSAGGYYASMKDFNEFVKASRGKYLFSNALIDRWIKEIKIGDFSSVKSIAEDLRQLFVDFINTKQKYVEFDSQYSFMKTILGLLTNLKPDMQSSEIYPIITDFPLMLMDFHTVSYSSYVEDLRLFLTKVAAGLYGEQIRDADFPVTGIIEDVLNTGEFRVTNDIYELRRIGLGDDINSVHIFPVKYQNTTIGIFNIYDSEISDKQIETLTLFTQVIGYLLGVAQMSEVQKKTLERISSLHLVTSIMDPTSSEEDLFSSIVEKAGAITRADRTSLMLLEDDMLHLKAAKGINKHVAKGIRVKVGEPVAGKVMETKSPLMIRDISKEFLPSGKVGSTYKTRAFISIPLVIRDRAIGVLNVADKITGAFFSEEDFEMLKNFASYATVVIEGSQYYRLAEEMRELSITDSLTGIFNRRHFNDRLVDEIQRSVRHNLTFALAVADIDNFKAFNDAEGHLAGDSVLKAISNILQESLRSIDVLARFGGEEFALILPQTEKEEAYQIAERIRHNIKKYCPKFWKIYPEESITVSIGISVFPQDGKDARDLIKNADKALYIAKMQGKDRTVIASSHK
jgi:diguanylate cyclase (GGDEF)-like protein